MECWDRPQASVVGVLTEESWTHSSVRHVQEEKELMNTRSPTEREGLGRDCYRVASRTERQEGLVIHRKQIPSLLSQMGTSATGPKAGTL